ncbi:hypothetical protein CSUI_009468, partial [Cystoisospora suis]
KGKGKKRPRLKGRKADRRDGWRGPSQVWSSGKAAAVCARSGQARQPPAGCKEEEKRDYCGSSTDGKSGCFCFLFGKS